MLKNANRCCHSHFKFEFSPFASERHAIWGYQKSLITRSSRGQVLCKSTCQQQTISASKFIKKNAVPRIRVESWCRVYRFSKAVFSPRTAFFFDEEDKLELRGIAWVNVAMFLSRPKCRDAADHSCTRRLSSLGLFLELLISYIEPSSQPSPESVSSAGASLYHASKICTSLSQRITTTSREKLDSFRLHIGHTFEPVSSTRRRRSSPCWRSE